MPQMIVLPEPCSQDWNKMTPSGRGRHCAQCAKTVVDFTNWPAPAILAYLQTHAGTCGRFLQQQLNVPLPTPEDFVQQIVNSPLSFLRKVAAIFLFAFGLISCTQQAPGSASPVQTSQPVGDTVMRVASTLPTGVVDLDSPSSTPALRQATHPTHTTPSQMLGEPAYEPPMGGAPMVVEAPALMGDTVLPAPAPDSL